MDFFNKYKNTNVIKVMIILLVLSVLFGVGAAVCARSSNSYKARAAKLTREVGNYEDYVSAKELVDKNPGLVTSFNTKCRSQLDLDGYELTNIRMFLYDSDKILGLYETEDESYGGGYISAFQSSKITRDTQTLKGIRNAKDSDRYTTEYGTQYSLSDGINMENVIDHYAKKGTLQEIDWEAAGVTLN